MQTRTTWLILLSCWTLLLSGCGGSEDEPAERPVATVGDASVTAEELGFWTDSFRSLCARSGCGTGSDSPANLAMEFLIEAHWVRAEASRRQIGLTKAEISRRLREEAASLGGFRQFGGQTGFNARALRTRIVVDSLRRKLEGVAFPRSPQPSNREIAAYFAAHREQFRVPNGRELRMVVTRKKGNAEEARQALESGLGWEAAVDRYAIDAAKGARSRTTVLPSNAIPELREGAFRATPGVVEGPQRVQGTWWVFEVVRVRPGRPGTFRESAPTIRKLLEAEAEEVSLERLKRLLRSRYRKQTICVERYAVPNCGNYRS